MALVELDNLGLIHFLVSTNVDGLHRRAGTPANKMAELHGNCYKEVCNKCGKEYLRTFDVTRGRMDHKTGRSCEDEQCRGELLDDIINFGENLPHSELNATREYAKKVTSSHSYSHSSFSHSICLSIYLRIE